jgi:hypothetical protein
MPVLARILRRKNVPVHGAEVKYVRIRRISYHRANIAAIRPKLLPILRQGW